MAADSAVMVIDAAKGVEAQTIKLFKVCTLRHIPIFTFINKMDREARDPFELMENIETILGIKTYPMNWPIGCGKEFKGVFDRGTRKVLAFESDGRANGVKMVDEITAELGAPEMDELIGAANHQKLADDIELLDGAAEEFDLDAVQHGQLSPVFFGSALTNFGVEPFLKEFLRLTPPPLPRKDAPTGDVVDPCSEQFSGFVFKIQANMNKNHRDRIAFLRICSGKFERGMEAFHVQEGKNIKLATGTSLMADDRAIVDEAYAGDIIGLFDPGIFSIGDTLCTGKQHVQFAGIPTFAPEHFARVTQVDTMKRKQFVKGMEQIAQEGAIQIFRDLGSGMEEVIVGVVGVLQLEVLEYRLRNEYNVDIRMQTLPYEHLRWIMNDPDELERIMTDVQELDGVDWENCTLTRYDNDYQNAKESLEGLQNIVFIAIAVVSVICFLVLALFLTLRLRGRIHETGVYLAMGISKGSVLLQYLLEVILVAAIALVISFGTSTAISHVTSETYETVDLTGERVAAEEEPTEDLGLAEIEVAVSAEDYALVWAFGMVLCVASTALAAYPIMKMKPKSILSQMS